MCRWLKSFLRVVLVRLLARCWLKFPMVARVSAVFALHSLWYERCTCEMGSEVWTPRTPVGKTSTRKRREVPWQSSLKQASAKMWNKNTTLFFLVIFESKLFARCLFPQRKLSRDSGRNFFQSVGSDNLINNMSCCNGAFNKTFMDPRKIRSTIATWSLSR